MSKQDEIFEAITAKLVKVIETGNEGRWTKPWTTMFSASGLTMNASTKKNYLGMNALVGMMVTAIEEYRTNLWATYKQWQSLGAQVRKGEKGVKMVKWGVTYRCSTCNTKGRTPCENGHVNEKNVWASSFTVFNADQQDGWDVPEAKDLGDAPEAIEAIERFVKATGAEIRHQASDRAYMDFNADRITLPLREQFSTQAGYYGTKLHELTHWAGHSDRLDRQVGGSFGSDRYAAEELVAELGATFLAAHFGVEVEPHQEHAAYLASWLRVFKDDPRALYRASKQAQTAATFLLGFEAGEEVSAS